MAFFSKGLEPMIYLDNSATTKPRKEVMDTFVKANEAFYANPASLHGMGVEAERLLTGARQQIGKLLLTEAENIYFTSGGTESNNMAIFGIARANKKRGRHVMTSVIEHPSILESFKQLEREGFEVDYLSVNRNGQVSLQELESKLRQDTILVSIMHVNNEIGTIQPIAEIAEVIHSHSRAYFHSDCVQSFGKLPVNFEGVGPDAITVSGHKINGLKGTGLLAFRHKIPFEPLLFGGGQESGMRSGTVSVPNAASLAKAMRLSVEENRSSNFQKWKKELISFFSHYEFIRIITPYESAPHILSISFRGIKGEVLVNALERQNIYVSTSSACSSRNTKTSHVIGAIHMEDEFVNGVIRISFGLYTTDDDIEDFKSAFLQAISIIKGEHL
ncbi:cysteine desulfurase family protein [Chungangia koreensis]|uniref:Cysteine desulfurase family protein n=2 Tax=Chungangia koreensis TaxID=752657 RepID=A0ABV8X317_9LACT